MKENIPTLLLSAKEYVSKGVVVVPLKPRSKYNFSIKDFRKTIRSVEAVEHMWGLCAKANISAPTSQKYNNWIIIDIDVKNGVNGVEKIKQIIKDNNLLLPDTAVAKSGSGGFHCYYRNTRETTVDSSDGRKLGIDIRAEKAYIILPPSIHFSGKQYSWYIGNIDSIANANNDVYKLVDIVNELNNKEKQRRENHEFTQVRSPIEL